MESKSAPAIALAVADAGWFTTENLFNETPEDRARTLLLRCVDYGNAWRRGDPPWRWGRRLTRGSPGIWERDLVLPPGWMKRAPRLGMRPIARAVRSWRKRHAGGLPLALVMTYPHYLYLAELVRPERRVYYNVDDYTLYWPRQADAVRAMEARAVRESGLTICVSKLRSQELKAAIPEAADRILHLPHGCPSGSIAERPLDLPAGAPGPLRGIARPYLGYIGTLGERVDWRLLDELAGSLPGASLVLIGRVDDGPESGWRAERARCLARPNVHLLGWRPQEDIAGYNRAFDVCLIPYRTDDPFNRACCPTKIGDYLASTRPVVSTALPECLLHSGLFDVAEDDHSFVDAASRIVEAGSDDGRAGARHSWAVEHSCRKVVGRLLDRIG